MNYFKIGMSAIEVLKLILSEQGVLQGTLVVHSVGLNWSQKYKDEEKKYNILESFIDFKKDNRIYQFSPQELNNSNLSKIVGDLNSNEVVSMSSKVITQSGENHIPMMNFHPECDFGLSQINEVIKEEIFPNKQGLILDSGRHQHYYGNFLINNTEWEQMLGQFLVPFYLVHPGYIGYQLMRGFSTLRLTSDSQYKPKIPEVIGLID